MAAVAVALLARSLAAPDPAPRQRHLPNGMRVVVQDNEHTATLVMCALVHVTALHEPHGKGGTRHLVQNMVARADGCAAEVAAAGARVGVSVAPDYVELNLSAPAESLAACPGLMRRMLFAPAFTQEALAAERGALMSGLAARDEVPAPRALGRFYECLYPGVGAGDLGAGDPATVAAIGLEDVRRFHNECYLPNATVVALSGGVDGAAAMQAITDAMSGLLPGAMPPQAPEPLPAQPDVARITGDRDTSVYVAGGRALPLASPDYPAAAVGFTALSSGMDSRLYRALRVERALAYTITGELTPSATAPSAFVLVACDPGRLDEVAGVVDAEIARITSQPLSAAELRRAKRYLIGRHALRRQRNQDVAHYLALFELLGGPQGFRRDPQLAGEIAAVNATAVTEAMRRLFEPTWAVRLEGRQTAQAD